MTMQFSDLLAAIGDEVDDAEEGEHLLCFQGKYEMIASTPYV